MKALNDAAKARAVAAWMPGRVHFHGEVPASPATPYLALSIGSGRPEVYRAGAGFTSKSRRLVVQAVGKDISEVAFAVEKAEAAFLGKRVTPDCTPCRSEVSSPVIRDPDGGSLLTVTITYTFTGGAEA